jgi:thioesterase domain-containing protein
VSLVALAPAGSGRPVFLIHGVNGTCLSLRALGTRLGVGRPCFGVQARGVDLREEPLDCVEAIAAAYVEEIRAKHAPDRWSLVGWSFGGLVAFEMAIQLARAGLPACPVLLDSRGLLDREESAPFQRAAALAHFEESLARAGGGAGDAAATAALRATYLAHSLALNRYRPGRLHGPAMVVRAEQGGDVTDGTLGLGDLTADPPEVVVAPGDHFSILEAPQVERVAALVSQFFARQEGN